MRRRCRGCCAWGAVLLAPVAGAGLSPPEGARGAGAAAVQASAKHTTAVSRLIRGRQNAWPIALLAFPAGWRRVFGGTTMAAPRRVVNRARWSELRPAGN